MSDPWDNPSAYEGYTPNPQESTPEALPSKEASGVPRAHAANSRPEIELSLMTRIVAVVDKYSKPCQEEGEHVVDYDDMEEDLESLIAQEADKLANKRVREELLNLRSQFEMMPWEVAGTMLDPMLGARTPEEIEAGREKNRTYGFASRYAYDKINDHIEELDKGDSQ